MKRIRGCATALVGVLLLTSSAVAQMPQPLTPEQQAAVEDGIREKLKDPDSARFKGAIKVPHEGDSFLVCGFVNSKNSFGGYVGFTPFHGLLLTMKRKTDNKTVYLLSVPSIGGNEISPQTVYDWCASEGMVL